MAAAGEDIVVSGFAARFPEADSLTEFKEKLYAGVDFVTDDESRWPRGHLGLPGRLGKIRDLSQFDPEFFGVPPKQADIMDPQMRLLLETCYEAIVDSGYDPQALRGRNVGVFIGSSNSETHEALSFDVDKIGGYHATGSLQSMLANRIAHSFNFQGMSMVVDTACSSTMSAFHLAFLSMRSGICEAAIVGGTSLCLKPAATLGFLRNGMLSPEGKCMTFDSKANGYVRSETVGIFFLQRASEALRIYAKVAHVKTTSDGYRSEGITFPSGPALTRLFRDSYTEARVDPRTVGYVEAHGTGTQVGDCQELHAVSNVFCQPGRETPLKVGAVKTNVGHSEPASGICALAKVILCFETGNIAGNLHFQEPNPNIPSLHDGSIEVVDKVTSFPGGPIGLNSFGLGGSCVHAILEPREGLHVDDIPREKTYLPRLVVMAGRSKESLANALHRLEEEGPFPDSAYALLNRVGQPNVRLFPYRGFALVPVDGSSEHVVKALEHVPPPRRPLWFAFTGMGCHWKGMARHMMKFDAFARSMRKSHDVLRKFGLDLIDVVFNEMSSQDSMASVQASILAVQVALVDTLGELGIQPDGVVGHSVGEIGCAYADGCLTAEQAVLCSYWRGHCIDMGKLPDGAMAAVGLTWEEVAKRCPDGVVPACHNAKDSVTVSGPRDAVAALVEELKAEGVFVREVDSSNVAFHSPHMQVVEPAFREAVKEVLPEPKSRSKRWVSSSMPETEWHEAVAQHCSVDYLAQNLVGPVLFYEAVQHVPKDAILVEIGPHCLLQPILRRALSPSASCIGLMKRGEDNIAFFLSSIGKLHTLGVQMDLSALYPPVSFPVPRGTPSIGHLVSWDHSQQWTVAQWNKFGGSRQISEDVVEINVDSNEADAYLTGHQVAGRLVYPAAGYMLMAWKSLAKRIGKPFDQVPVEFENVTFYRATILPKTGPLRFLVHVMPASGEFEVSEGGSLAAKGRILVAEGDNLCDKDSPHPPAEKMDYEIGNEDIYKGFKILGYEYSGAFRSILEADSQNLCGKLTWADNWVTFLDSILQLRICLDKVRTFRLPRGIESCHINPQLHAQVVEEVRNGGIHAVYNSCIDACYAGGVVIRGMKCTISTSRGARQVPCLEKYQFIPYIHEQEVGQVPDSGLLEYIGACSAIVRRMLEANDEKLTEVPGLSKEARDVPEDVLNRYLKSPQEMYTLISALTAIETHVDGDGSSLVSAVKSVLTAHKPDLDKDILNTALLENPFLKPLLDVAVENTSRKKIRVLELAFGETHLLLLPRVTQVFPLSIVPLKIEYSLAHPRPNEVTTQQLSDGVMRYCWDQSSTPNNELPEAELLLACIAPSMTKNLEPIAAQLSKLCKEDAFVLLCLRTALTSAEQFLSTVGEVPSAAHPKDTAISILVAHGFSFVGQASNSWSALLLLRKKGPKLNIQEQEIVIADNTTFGWVETLKAKITECESKPPGQNLWLIGKDIGISGIVGLMNCLRLESAASRLRCVLDASLKERGSDSEFTLSELAFEELLERDLLMNVYRDGKWGSFRHLMIPADGAPKISTEYAFLNVHTRGDMSSLQWYESPLTCSSPSSCSNRHLCSVYYAPLNFRDVMIATGKLPPDALPDGVVSFDCLLGLEFSGRDSQGRRVMGLVPAKGLATAVAVDADWLWEVPDTWSLEEASTVPVVYSTAYYALLVRGNMRPGESILVHSGSGGVGQAAISIALSMGCTVFTTVGSQEKRDFLKRRFKELGDHNIGSSRDISFEELVRKQTKGRGVDLVLNSLSEKKLQASVRCLARQGRFLEIGKFDLSRNSSLGMSVFLKGISFQGILLETLHSNESFILEEKQRVRQLVQEGIASGAVQPLKSNRFPWHQFEEAFRFMASGKHIGKVVLEVRQEESPRKMCLASPLKLEAVPRTYFYEHKSYVIVGGLGGVGLEVSNWVVERGCRSILLTSRSGVQTKYQKSVLRHLERAGAKVHVIRVDVSTEAGARQIIHEALAMGPIGAIFNLAMVLSDGLFENQTPESFERVCKPKVHGTMLLDELSRKLCPELDHFVVFSSVSCGRGNAGQTNYGYANSVMERICERRVADGLPGLAIQWGAIGDVGVLHEATGGDVELAGCTSQRISSCLNVLDQFLRQSHPVVSSVVKVDRSSSSGEKGTSRNLAETIAQIFGMKDPSNVNPNMTLRELGMDSLMGVEVQQTLERDYDLTLSISEIQQLTFTKLRDMTGQNWDSTGETETTVEAQTTDSA